MTITLWDSAKRERARRAENRGAFALWLVSWQRRVKGWHGMKEHVLADKLIFNFVCGESRFYIHGNRV